MVSPPPVTRSWVSWAAVDGRGCDLDTGSPPAPPGAVSPAAALASAAAATWPVAVVASDGRRLGLGAALGPGGDRVERLMERLLVGPVPAIPGEVGAGATVAVETVEALARSTPLGPVAWPVRVVPRRQGVDAVAALDAGWVDRLEVRRRASRRELARRGRDTDLEAALHVAMVLATERLDPVLDDDVDAHVASGAQLWILGAAVAWCLLAPPERDPFAAWAELVVRGWWPVGPSRGRLVVAQAT